jgi:hypothetical protein
MLGTVNVPLTAVYGPGPTTYPDQLDEELVVESDAA